MKWEEEVKSVYPNAKIDRVVGHAYSVTVNDKEIGRGFTPICAWYHAAKTIKGESNEA